MAAPAEGQPAGDEWDWTRPYRAWEATLKDELPDTGAARTGRAAAACGGYRHLDRTVERRLFEQPVDETLRGMELAVRRGARMYAEGRLDRAVHWYERAAVAYDYAFPDDPATQAALDGARRAACLGAARAHLVAREWRRALLKCREAPCDSEARLLEAQACRELDLFEEARAALAGLEGAVRERPLLAVRERAYAANAHAMSKRVFLPKPPPRNSILPTALPACRRDALDDAARPLDDARAAFAALVETLSGDGASDRARLNTS